MASQNRLWGICVALMILGLSSASVAAPRLFLDSRATNLDPTNRVARLYFRELPRQALLIAAAHDLGLTCVDPTIDPAAIPAEGDLSIGFDYKAAADRFVLTFNLYDSSNQPLDVATLTPRANAANIAYLDELVAQVDELVQSKWKGIIATQFAAEARPARWDPSLAAPNEIEGLLAKMDLTSAFLATKLIHQAIAETGESPARLAALVRAYTNLGESTRNLISGASVAYFCRALLYSQRLIRLAPDEPSTWWARSYINAIYGAPLIALADLQRAEALKPQQQPVWVQMLRRFIAYDTLGLLEESRGRGGAMACYLSWMTIEHASLTTLPANFAAEVLTMNPGCLRAVDCIISNTQSTVQHQYVFRSTRVLNDLLTAFAAAPSVSPEAQRAAIDLSRPRPTQAQMVRFRQALESIPQSPDLLPWSIFAVTIADAQFVNAVRQLTHMQHNDNDDVRPARDQWVDLLADHRYIDYLSSFGVGNAQPTPDIIAKVRSMNFKDDPSAAHIMQHHLRFLQIEKDPRRDLFWVTRWRQQS